jgi:hypothetical protein
MNNNLVKDFVQINDKELKFGHLNTLFEALAIRDDSMFNDLEKGPREWDTKVSNKIKVLKFADLVRFYGIHSRLVTEYKFKQIVQVILDSFDYDDIAGGMSLKQRGKITHNNQLLHNILWNSLDFYNDHDELCQLFSKFNGDQRKYMCNRISASYESPSFLTYLRVLLHINCVPTLSGKKLALRLINVNGSGKITIHKDLCKEILDRNLDSKLNIVWSHATSRISNLLMGQNLNDSLAEFDELMRCTKGNIKITDNTLLRIINYKSGYLHNKEVAINKPLFIKHLFEMKYIKITPNIIKLLIKKQIRIPFKYLCDKNQQIITYDIMDMCLSRDYLPNGIAENFVHDDYKKYMLGKISKKMTTNIFKKCIKAWKITPDNDFLKKVIANKNYNLVKYIVNNHDVVIELDDIKTLAKKPNMAVTVCLDYLEKHYDITPKKKN